MDLSKVQSIKPNEITPEFMKIIDPIYSEPLTAKIKPE
jgi:hypothetical protein